MNSQSENILKDFIGTTNYGPKYRPIFISPYISDNLLSKNMRTLKKIYNHQSKHTKDRLYKKFMGRIINDLYKYS